jgi:putative heme-binding domain-containing protein
MIHLDFARDINRIYALDQKPAQGDFGLAGARIITPGDPFASVLYYRMAKLGRGRMPHIGSRITDRAGLELIYNWIEQLEQRPVVDKPAGSPRVDVPATADVVGATLREDDIPKALSSTRGALMLARRMEKGQVSQGVQKHAVTLGTSHIDVNVRDLFERFVPPAERTQRLGDAIDPAAILSLAGDPERGRRLYFFGAASGCMNCHQVHAVGGKLGPDLTKIGEKYKRRELLEAILEPSKQIEDAYRSYVLVTHAGDIYTGLLAEKTDQEIILEDASRDVIRVPVGEVARFEPQHASIMPDLLLSDLTAQEAADLLAYLSMLK